MIIQVEIILLTVVFVVVVVGGRGGGIIGALSFLCSLDPFPGIYLHSHIYFLILVLHIVDTLLRLAMGAPLLCTANSNMPGSPLIHLNIKYQIWSYL